MDPSHTYHSALVSFMLTNLTYLEDYPELYVPAFMEPKENVCMSMPMSVLVLIICSLAMGVSVWARIVQSAPFCREAFDLTALSTTVFEGYLDVSCLCHIRSMVSSVAV